MAAVSTGNTYLKVTWGDQQAYGEMPVVVLPGTAPLPAFDIEGFVHEAGGSAAANPINDAMVEVVAGPLKGRSTKSGSEPVPTAGFYPSPIAPGGFHLLGTPVGHYLLRVSKAAYVTQERDVVAEAGTKMENFALSRQP